MDSIPSSHQDLPPYVVRPGSTFENLAVEDIDVLISEQQAKILEHEASIRATIMHYEQLIAHRHRAIARYRSCRNERTALINRVLPEIFSEILLQYSFISQRDNGYYSWLKAAHVCRYWRNVVRSMPRLFSYIRLPVVSPTHLDEFILASRQLPLHVKCMSSRDGHSSELWEKVLPRTQSLYLDVHPLVVRRRTWPVCPNLSSLVWAHNIGNLRSDDKAWPRGIDCIAPNLQSLKIEMVILGVDWLQHPLPPLLTTLTLHHNTTTLPQGTMADLIRTLTSLTSLKSIELSGLRRNDYRSEPNDNTAGEISHLGWLSLKGALSPISAFLRHVRVVDNVHLVVAKGYHLEELQLLPPMLRTKLLFIASAGTSCPVPSIELRLVARDSVSASLRLTIWASSEGCDRDPSTLPKARLDIRRVPFTDILKLLDAFSNGLSDHFIPAKHLTLALYDERHQPIGGMQDTLRQLLNVTHLTMELPHPTGESWAEYSEEERDVTFLVGFSSILAPSDSENQEPVVLPNMHTLRIVASGSNHHVFEIFYVNTLGALRRRRDAYGLRLRTLELIDPSSFIPSIDDNHARWQDTVDEQVIKTTG